MTEAHHDMTFDASASVAKLVASWVVSGLAFLFSHMSVMVGLSALVLNVVVVAHTLWRWRHEARRRPSHHRTAHDE